MNSVHCTPPHCENGNVAIDQFQEESDTLISRKCPFSETRETSDEASVNSTAVISESEDSKILSSENSHEPSPLCWSCKKEKAKYKCPRCLTRTCSVSCVKNHKEVMDCNGKRNKTEYVPKEGFNESHLLSDYRLLEEINRCVCANDRNKPSHPYKTNWMKFQLKKATGMKINLIQLPKNFQRRKENSTFYNMKTKNFLWHIEWIFTSCKLVVPEKRFSDTIPLLEGVTKYVKAAAGNTYYDPRLNDYSKATSLNFYMKKEKTPANNTLYYKLNGNEGLCSILPGKTIIEYPRVFVVLPGETEIFDDSLVEDGNNKTLSSTIPAIPT